jgi:uncharacterized protein (DUF2235 family)
MTPRNIVLLSDGTGNSRGKLNKTNVWRTYEALDLADPAAPETPRQFAFYDDGVGTSSFKPLALLGGALGIGLVRNVRDLYEFLCRTYRPGDRIYAFGFSRGAFTIRVLLGLICNQGLVPYRGNEAELRRLSVAAFRAYRRQKYRLPLNWIAFPRALRDLGVDIWARLCRRRRYAEVVRQDVEVTFVGVWDTVAAYGMPIDEIATFINAVVWPLDLPNLALHPRVQRAAHALALDDERSTFHPKLWDPDPRIAQVWFAGMHSDVGGGYPDQGLAHISLTWMLAQAQAADLRFAPAIREQQQALADENGPMNDSRHGLAGYYRYKPRELPGEAVVHASALRRIRIGQDAYVPLVLPPDFQELGFDGVIRPGSKTLDGFDADAYAEGRELALNLVWWRRGAYFATVAATLALFALPLIRDDAGAACTTNTCWLSPAINAVRKVLPSMADGWAAWYAANPGTLLIVGGPVAAGLWLGGRLQLKISDAMRRVWYRIPAVRPTSLAAGTPPRPKATATGKALAALRNSPAYRNAIAFVRRWVLPTLAGLVLSAVGLMLCNALWFSIKASDGDFCTPSVDPTAASATPATADFDNRLACAPTRLLLRTGGTYEIALHIADPNDWKDRTLPADWLGLHDVPWVHRALAPMKRELALPVFTPIARIGAKGSDVYSLAPDPSMPTARPRTTLQARIVARTDGELFLYVNDVVGPPWDPLRFYDNNHGIAKVTVRQVVPPQR